MKLATYTFTAPELYLIAAAFGGNVLFGLPSKEIYQLKGGEVFKEAYERLIEKKILTEEGKLTETGTVIIRTVELYYKSEKYVRINNLMFAFRDKKHDELIVLIEFEDHHYELRVISKALVLRLLTETFPVMLREPEEKEKTFLKEELSHREKREMETFEPEPMLMNLEFFHLKEEPQDENNAAYYQQWLVFTKDEKLIMVDTVQQKYYHASQYWFLKILFDELDFPYKEVKANG